MAEGKCAGYPNNRECGNVPTVRGENGVLRCTGCVAGLLAWTLAEHDARRRHTVGTPEWEKDQEGRE